MLRRDCTSEASAWVVLRVALLQCCVLPTRRYHLSQPGTFMQPTPCHHLPLAVGVALAVPIGARLKVCRVPAGLATAWEVYLASLCWCLLVVLFGD